MDETDWQYPIVRHFLFQRPGRVCATCGERPMPVVFGLRPKGSYPFLLSELHALVMVSGASGTFGFAIEFARINEQAVQRTAEVQITFEHRGSLRSFTRVFERLPFPAAGEYEGRLFARMLCDRHGEPVGDEKSRWRQIGSSVLQME